MLSLRSDKPQPLVEGMGFRAGDVASDGNLSQSPPERPMFGLLQQTPAYSAAALIRGYDQTQDLAEVSHFEDIVLRCMDPAHDQVRRYLRDENDMIWLHRETLEPAPDRFRLDRVTNHFTQFRQPGRIAYFPFPDRHVRHVF